MSKFCEAIVEYMANINTAPDPSITMALFSGEILSAWEIFFNVWLTSKEAKVMTSFLFFISAVEKSYKTKDHKNLVKKHIAL